MKIQTSYGITDTLIIQKYTVISKYMIATYSIFVFQVSMWHSISVVISFMLHYN